MYYRFYGPKSPMSDCGHAMFAANRDRVDHYGPAEYHYDGRDGVKVEDLYDLIREAWADESARPYDRDGLGYYRTLSADDICGCFTPTDIVDGADGFDCGELNQWLWERVLYPQSIYAVLTPDGAVVYEEALIERVA